MITGMYKKVQQLDMRYQSIDLLLILMNEFVTDLAKQFQPPQSVALGYLSLVFTKGSAQVRAVRCTACLFS